MQKIKITYGGWYQRTTIHLSEIYDFLAFGKSKLQLDKNVLNKMHKGLRLREVSRESNYLEYIVAKTKDGITIRYYEDGLYVLEVEAEDIKQSKILLEKYFNNKFNLAIEYIFSLGAPTPKILANIKNTHVAVVTVKGRNEKVDVFLKEIGHVYNKISTTSLAVHKTHAFIFVVAENDSEDNIDELVENLIFFREFKDQLEKYLQIHRILWEKIFQIKERKEIRGNEVEMIRSELDSYQTTISLINNRINQMGSYVRTRASISKRTNIEQYMTDLFQYKFETLIDTLDYIKEIWKMTSDYLNSSIQNLVEIKGQSAARGIQSLQLITSIGVISGIVGYLSKNEMPKITAIGAAYFFVVIAITWLVNSLISGFYKKKKYELKLNQRKEDI